MISGFRRDFWISFKISLEIVKNSRISIEIQHPSYTLFVSFNALASMNKGYSSRFVFRYDTALTAGQVCDSHGLGPGVSQSH